MGATNEGLPWRLCSATISAMTVLHLAGTYRRSVAASVARIRENVLDWEHLPALHAASFAACELVDADSDGWRIRLVNQGSDAPQILKLYIAPDTSAYRVVTEAGFGTGSEIRVAVTPQAAHQTDVVVDYHVPEADPDRLAMIGAAFVAIYERLWDEDEAMMVAREAALAPRPKARFEVDLGEEATLVLPLAFDLGSGRFRLLRRHGALIAHSLACPHWLGPLDGAVDGDGSVTCPWHGYRFDVCTGRSSDGRGLRLAPPPHIRIDKGRVIANTSPAK
jgi:nitrite reductase/ring-hydroxylating ferredoxin subunit